MKWLTQRPSVLRDGNSQSEAAPDIVKILFTCGCFLGVFLIGALCNSVVPSIFTVPEMLAAMVRENVNPSDPNAIMQFSMGDFQMSVRGLLLQLYTTGLTTYLTILYCRELEKRSFSSMGLLKRRLGRDYLVGLGVGLALFSGAILIAMLAGGLRYDGTALNGKFGLLLVLIGGWMIQGMSEEVVFRGFFCNSLTRYCSRHAAAVISALAFMAAHLANPGVSLLACVNLFLFGLFAAYYMFRFDSLWGICALHTVWNFAQGNLYGIQVSGLNTAVSVFRFSPVAGGASWNGGAFGMEGGLAVSIVLIIGIALIWFLPEKQRGLSAAS